MLSQNEPTTRLPVYLFRGESATEWKELCEISNFPGFFFFLFFSSLPVSDFLSKCIVFWGDENNGENNILLSIDVLVFFFLLDVCTLRFRKFYFENKLTEL